MDGLYTMKWDYRFTFGKYKACRVDEVFRNGWYGKSYLVWAYYYKEDITFTDEILDALELTDRIDKPGSNPEKYGEWLDTLPEEVRDMLDTYQKNVRLGVLSHKRSVTKKYYSNRLKKHEDAMERVSSAGRLAWKNQGH